MVEHFQNFPLFEKHHDPEDKVSVDCRNSKNTLTPSLFCDGELLCDSIIMLTLTQAVFPASVVARAYS